jgi:aquaporin Z
MLVAHPLHAKAASEFLATGTFCAVGVGSAMALADAGPIGLVGIALTHGFAIALVMTAFGHVSGAHVNPAVTIGQLALHKLSLGVASVYVLAQLLGAIAGTALIRLAYPRGTVDATGGGVVQVAANASTGQALLMEALLTFLLVTGIMAVAIDRDGAWFRVAGLPIGLLVTTCIIAGGPVTGGAMNPARTFAPALLSWEWGDQWIYWVGAILGGVLASLVYVFVFRPRYHDAPT